MPEPILDDLKWAIAKAEIECPACEYAVPWKGCENCDGTGTVYLLGDDVRVKCYHCQSGTTSSPEIRGIPQRMRSCESCQGRGWTPTTDGDVMAQAVWPLLLRIRERYHAPHDPEERDPRSGRDYTQFHIAYTDYIDARTCGYSPAAWEAAWRALVAAGVVEKETP